MNRTPGNWSADDLSVIAHTGEVHVASQREDGTFTQGQIIWIVVADGGVFIRSTDGPVKPWFRAAQTRGLGRLQAAGHTWDVRFIADPDADESAIEDAYRSKYQSSPQRNVNRAGGSRSTLRLVPRD